MSGNRTLFSFAAAAVLAAGVALIPASSFAAICPGTMHVVGGKTAYVHGGGTMNSPTNMFVGSGCTGVPMGAATMCTQNVTFTAMFVNFIAKWPDTMARTGDLTGGCLFMCSSNNCYVRAADALPVELLTFGVD